MNVNGGCYGHSGTQTKVIVLARIQGDDDRNTLHYFYVVPGRVLRGQKAETRAAGCGKAL